MDNLIQIFKNVENKWLQPLSEICRKQFSGCHLPSHNEAHHLRVWKYAKLLLKNIPSATFPFQEEDIERLIIAVFFHDQGMSITPSKEHGKISRQLCKSYFEEGHLMPPSHFDQVLKAIEQHDQKDYSGVTKPEHSNLLEILNIADDLDAFGIIGAYRYIEIYLMRKIALTDLPEKVIENLHNRFSHFTKVFFNNKTLIQSQNLRYMAARNFFKDLNLQLKIMEYNPSLKIGPIGIVHYIQKNIFENKKSLSIVINEAKNSGADFYFSHFFEKLSKEI